MRSVQDNHAHAESRHKALGIPDYFLLLKNVIEAKKGQYLSLTVHLPFEIEHPDIYPNLYHGRSYIRFGEFLKRAFGINLYWENAPAQIYEIWSLKHGQMTWELIPKDIAICLDTGHVMLGTKDKNHAREALAQILKERGKQIKHLHVHENDLLHDIHTPIGDIITPDLFKALTKNRTFIFEKG